MSDYSLNIKGRIGLCEYSNIHDYSCIVGTRDRLLVTIDNTNSENVEIICNILIDSGLTIISKKVDNNGKSKIEAFRLENIN